MKLLNRKSLAKILEVTKRIIDQINWISLLTLVVVTPVLFTTATSELFEVPKMLFVYFVAIVATTATLLKFVIDKKITIPKNLIFLTLLLFLAVQIASTISSIDKFTSVFGYPSRLNGGLLSQVAYSLIFFCAILNLDRVKSQKIFLVAIATATAVSLWGIPGYFGRDPNCLVLTGSLNSSCWQQEFDPTKRIFSTLGQPNWLASYLVLILPLALSQIFRVKNPQKRILFCLITLIILTALILTNSRAGLAGLIVTLILFFALLGTGQIKKNFKFFLSILVPIILIATVAGTTLFSRIYEAVSPRKGQGPTESGQIRLIVWQGAVEIFKNNPILGTGPETFAYSYYKYRPLAHNLTTEWNFFYNKAHNEFLNYLANLGILGFISYGAFLTVTVLTLWKSRASIAVKGVLSGLIGYQVTILFGFSTVATQAIMFLIVAAAQSPTLTVSFKFPSLKKGHQLIIGTALLIVGAAGIAGVLRLFIADVLITRAQNLTLDNPKLLAAYTLALSTSPIDNPFYLADAAYRANSAPFAQKAETLAPNNLLVLRKVANTYFLLSQTDKNYEDDAIRVAQRLTKLAPTDPQSYLTLAKIQIGLVKFDDAQKSLATALQLKPDYLEAQQILEQLTTDN